MNSTDPDLEVLSLISTRLSHSLRSPLSVSLGVLDDLSRGYELSREEILDGKTALLKILGTLDRLSELSVQPQLELSELSVPGLFQEFSDVTLSGHESALFFADAKLLGRAISAIVRYARFYRSRFAEPSAPLMSIIERPGGNPGTHVEIELRIVRENAFRLKPELTSRELVRQDHAFESIGLIFADAVLRLHQGELKLGWNEQSGFHMRMSLGCIR